MAMEVDTDSTDSVQPADCPILCLADELICIILGQNALDHRDLCSLSKVCLRLNNIVSSQEVWHRKSQQRWSVWHRPAQGNWSEVYKNRHYVEVRVLSVLETIIPAHYSKKEVSDEEYDSIVQLTLDGKYSQYVDDTIEEILKGTPRTHNLTMKMYAQKLKKFLQFTTLKQEFQTFFSVPESEQFLEKGALLVALAHNFDNRNIDPNSVSEQLDVLAQQAKRHIEEGGTLLSEADDLSKVNAIRQVMFVEQGFQGNVQNYSDQDNSMIDKVLVKCTGIPITLSVVFAEVARRLHVKMEPVNFPSHFLLRWKSNSEKESSDPYSYTYVDCFNGGRLLEASQYLIERRDLHFQTERDIRIFFQVASPKQVIARVLRNIMYNFRPGMSNNVMVLQRYTQEYIVLASEGTELYLSERQKLLGIYYCLEINQRQILSCYEELQARSSESNSIAGMRIELLAMLEGPRIKREQEYTPKLRSDEKHSGVLYRVGQLMKHKRYQYRCVIYGWDPTCEMREEWIARMGVDRLSNGRHQPFYNVLVEDGTDRYAAQENLTPDNTGKEIPHSKVGLHFKEYREGFYIPNEQLSQIYKED